MPSHVRQQIRAELRARLVGLPHAADPLAEPIDSLDRVEPESAVPCAVVDMPIEEIRRRKGDAEEAIDLGRELTITVWLVATRTSGARGIDRLEEMAAEVERRLAVPWNGRCFELQTTDFDDERRRGALPFRSASLTYAINYVTRDGAPDELI